MGFYPNGVGCRAISGNSILLCSDMGDLNEVSIKTNFEFKKTTTRQLTRASISQNNSSEPSHSK